MDSVVGTKKNARILLTGHMELEVLQILSTSLDLVTVVHVNTCNLFNPSDFDHTIGVGGHFVYISSTNRDQLGTKARLISYPQQLNDHVCLKLSFKQATN